jgi:UDP-N-acetylmuramate dehydrogenase
MNIQENISLKAYNTFGIDATAQFFTELTDTNDLPILATAQQYNHRKIIGGGSNILLTQPVAGLLIANHTKGIEVLKEDEAHVWLKVASGEIWHELVLHVIGNNWSGIENLALIPGTVGAAPIQNIGAYGVEVKDVIESVTFWHWEEKKMITFNNEECHFAYRDSIFKQELKDQFFIVSVVFRLNKQAQLNISYGAIEEELKKMNVDNYTPKAIAEAVIRIRTSKLPDPKVIGNAGSFFKNPTITTAQFQQLQAIHSGIPSYKINENWVKVPAGWLIEQCGWKGYRKDDYGVHQKQALVLVNYGHANGNEIWELSGNIVASVKDTFGIELEREVQVW